MRDSGLLQNRMCACGVLGSFLSVGGRWSLVVVWVFGGSLQPIPIYRLACPCITCEVRGLGSLHIEGAY